MGDNIVIQTRFQKKLGHCTNCEQKTKCNDVEVSNFSILSTAPVRTTDRTCAAPSAGPAKGESHRGDPPGGTPSEGTTARGGGTRGNFLYPSRLTGGIWGWAQCCESSADPEPTTSARPGCVFSAGCLFAPLQELLQPVAQGQTLSLYTTPKPVPFSNVS